MNSQASNLDLIQMRHQLLPRIQRTGSMNEMYLAIHIFHMYEYTYVSTYVRIDSLI